MSKKLKGVFMEGNREPSKDIMKAKVLLGALVAFLVLSMPFAYAQGLSSGFNVSIEANAKIDKTGAEANARTEASGEAGVHEGDNDSSSRSEGEFRSKVRSEIEVELNKISVGAKLTVKEAIQKRRELLESLKAKLLESGPENRSMVAREINRARLEGLVEIKALVSSSEDVKAFEKERLEAAADLCIEVSADENCKEEIENRKNRIEGLAESELKKLTELKSKAEKIWKTGESIRGSENLRKFKVKLALNSEGEVETEVLAREISQEILGAVDVKLERINLTKIKVKIEADKGLFLEIRAKADSCKEAQGCEKARADLSLAARGFLLNIIDYVLAKLEKIKLTIQAENSLTAEEEARELENINAHISVFAHLKVGAENITEETNRTVLQGLSREAKKALDSLRSDLDVLSGFVQTSKMGGILVKSSKLSEKLNVVLQKMVLADVKITAEMEAFVASFNQVIENIKADFDGVQEKFKQAANKTGDERNRLLKEAQASLRGLKEEIKKLNQGLKEFVRSLKESGSAKLLVHTKADVAIEAEEKVFAEMQGSAETGV